jgi:hypothetical protein
MFKFEELKQIQVEITNRCQASCPMCLRNIHGGIENPDLILSDWTLEEFKTIFSQEVLNKLQTINFCGDFGDPIINNNLPEMCSYIKDNSQVSVVIHTNGSARTIAWWKNLVDCLPMNHRVVFALDGLEDTHSLYRIGTNYQSIKINASAFIQAGGTAEWCFIKFKHNEHQVEQARAISKELGFDKFSVKNSKRFSSKFPVLDKTGNISHYIEQPTDSSIRPIEFVELKDYRQWTQNSIECFTLNDKEIYIDSHKYLMPCCLIGSFMYANYDTALYKQYGLIDDTSIIPIGSEIKDNVYSIIKEFGGVDNLNSYQHGIRNIMDSPLWENLVKGKWATGGSSACTVLCSNSTPYISVEEQYINRT